MYISGFSYMCEHNDAETFYILTVCSEPYLTLHQLQPAQYILGSVL